MTVDGPTFTKITNDAPCAIILLESTSNSHSKLAYHCVVENVEAKAHKPNNQGEIKMDNSFDEDNATCFMVNGLPNAYEQMRVLIYVKTMMLC